MDLDEAFGGCTGSGMEAVHILGDHQLDPVSRLQGGDGPVGQGGPGVAEYGPSETVW